VHKELLHASIVAKQHRPMTRSIRIAALALSASLAAQAQPAIDTRPVPAGDRTSRLPKPLQDGWQHGAFMEIFVRAYRDSDGDGIGDLRGLTQSLDHLQDLGIRGIWLMPVTKNADGDHGYATTDFRDIAPEYGTLAHFDELLRQAHRRGIGVIVDYVINHSAAAHPMFTEALQVPANRFHGWYVWADTAPQGWDIWGKNPWYATAATGHYFATFGPDMPDFNFHNPQVLEYHLSSLRFWLNRGLDGFRLDAVPHLIEKDAKDWNDQPQSRAITKQLQDLIKSYAHRTVVCEATAEPQAYGDPAVCGGAFAFGYTQHFVRAAKGDAASVQQLATYYRSARPTMATFVSNHDAFAGQRLWDQVGGDLARYKLAAAGYLLQPGTPYIYYGEEVGQAGVNTLAGDLPLRAPMSWTADARTAGFTRGTPFRPIAPNAATQNVAAERQRSDSILAFYKAMLKLRNTRPSIARGSFEGSFAQGLVAGWQRAWQGERTLVLINYGTASAEVAVPALPAGARLQPLFPRHALGARAAADGQATLRLPAQAVQVYQVLDAAR
jgi:alpha-amylase